MRKSILGVTLVELVIAIVVILAISVTAAPLMQRVSEALSYQYSAGSTQESARIGFERLSRELRLIRTTSDFTTNASNITFTKLDGTSVTYTLSGTTLQRDSRSIAKNVTGFTLSYYDSAGAVTATAANVRYIKISLTVTNSSNSQTFITTVFPRSFA